MGTTGTTATLGATIGASIGANYRQKRRPQSAQPGGPPRGGLWTGVASSGANAAAMAGASASGILGGKRRFEGLPGTGRGQQRLRGGRSGTRAGEGDQHGMHGMHGMHRGAVMGGHVPATSQSRIMHEAALVDLLYHAWSILDPFQRGFITADDFLDVMATIGVRLKRVCCEQCAQVVVPVVHGRSR